MAGNNFKIVVSARREKLYTLATIVILFGVLCLAFFVAGSKVTCERVGGVLTTSWDCVGDAVVLGDRCVTPQNPLSVPDDTFNFNYTGIKTR